MGRWEPNARERLEKAALDLFLERGYDDTTVAEIAARANLTKSTFFRYFADKREVLFWGQDLLGRLFSDAIASAPDAATPLDAIAAALDAAAAAFVPDRRPLAPRRQAVIASNSALREREMLKRAALATAMADALRRRGVTDPTATLAAELGTLALRTAYSRWADPNNTQDYTEIARRTVQELSAAAADLNRIVERPRDDDRVTP
jgi:AcrR family transcriptional regulator